MKGKLLRQLATQSIPMEPGIQDHEWQVRVLYKTENPFENSFFLQSQFFLLVHAHSFLRHRH